MNSFTPKTVELTSRAIKDLNKIKSFNKDLLGEEKAKLIIDKIFNHIQILESSNIDLKKVVHFIFAPLLIQNLLLDFLFHGFPKKMGFRVSLF